MGRILAIDYGLKRTGLAVTDPLQLIATALETVPTNGLLEFLKRYMAAEEVDHIVVGLPKDLQNRDTHATAPVNELMAKLRKMFPHLEVSTVDERFTSSIAAQSMALGGYKKKDRQKKENLDKVSATLILQTYLEQKRI